MVLTSLVKMRINITLRYNCLTIRLAKCKNVITCCWRGGYGEMDTQILLVGAEITIRKEFLELSIKISDAFTLDVTV